MKPAGEFDHDYCRKIQDACLKAILEASIDPATNTAMLRNAEIARALLRISATLTATSKEAGSQPRSGTWLRTTLRTFDSSSQRTGPS
jgi:hypothetical protein